MEIRPASWDDLEDVVEVLGVQNRAVFGVAGIQVEQLRHEWERPGFRVGEDNIVAEDDRRVAGYAAVTPDGLLVLAAAEEPLADALLERISARARGRGDTQLSVSVVSNAGPLASLVRRHPFVRHRETLLMWRRLGESIGDPAPPSGVALRTFRPDDAPPVHELLDAAYLAWDPTYVPLAHDAWEQWMTRDSEFDPTVWWLAERSGKLVGCALYWSSGWLKDIAVHESERGRGLGAMLVQQGLAEFTRRGKRRVGLKVDASNPTGAIRLYERLGFVAASSEAVWVSSL